MARKHNWELLSQKWREAVYEAAEDETLRHVLKVHKEGSSVFPKIGKGLDAGDALIVELAVKASIGFLRWYGYQVPEVKNPLIRSCGFCGRYPSVEATALRGERKVSCVTVGCPMAKRKIPMSIWNRRSYKDLKGKTK